MADKKDMAALINEANASNMGNFSPSAMGLGTFQYIDINKIVPSRTNYRKNFEKIHELGENLLRNGIIHPITVAPASGDEYRILAGERRYRAAKHIGLALVPCYIRSDVNDAELINLSENTARENLKKIELYGAVLDLKLKGLKSQLILASAGKSQKDWAFVSMAKEAAELAARLSGWIQWDSLVEIYETVSLRVLYEVSRFHYSNTNVASEVIERIFSEKLNQRKSIEYIAQVVAEHGIKLAEEDVQVVPSDSGDGKEVVIGGEGSPQGEQGWEGEDVLPVPRDSGDGKNGDDEKSEALPSAADPVFAASSPAREKEGDVDISFLMDDSPVFPEPLKPTGDIPSGTEKPKSPAAPRQQKKPVASYDPTKWTAKRTSEYLSKVNGVFDEISGEVNFSLMADSLTGTERESLLATIDDIELRLPAFLASLTAFREKLDSETARLGV